MMSIGFVFWLIMLIILILWIYGYVAPDTRVRVLGFGGYLILWILLCLLGWRVFGAPLGH